MLATCRARLAEVNEGAYRDVRHVLERRGSLVGALMQRGDAHLGVGGDLRGVCLCVFVGLAGLGCGVAVLSDQVAQFPFSFTEPCSALGKQVVGSARGWPRPTIWS